MVALSAQREIWYVDCGARAYHSTFIAEYKVANATNLVEF